MNDNALLYSNYGEEPRIDANYVLDKYSHLMKWQNSENILDIGSADGGVTSQILMPKLPKTVQKIIGVDISEKMVRYAKDTHKDHQKLDFTQLDITSKTIPLEFFEHFDHIFTFTCLNWVPEDKHPKALKNISDMLKPNGEVFMTIIARTPFYDFYENMAKDVKWKPYLFDVQKYVSVYHHPDNPQEKLSLFLEKAGFEVRFCELEERSITFPNFEFFWKWSEAIDPFIKDIPENKVKDYIDDYKKEVMKHKSITIDACGSDKKIYFSYSILIAGAIK